MISHVRATWTTALCGEPLDHLDTRNSLSAYSFGLNQYRDITWCTKCTEKMALVSLGSTEL